MSVEPARDPTRGGAFIFTLLFGLELVVFLLWKHIVVTGDTIQLRSYLRGGTPPYPGELTLCLVGLLIVMIAAGTVLMALRSIYTARDGRLRNLLATARIGPIAEEVAFLGLPALAVWLALEAMFLVLIGPVMVRPGTLEKFLGTIAWMLVILAILAIAAGQPRARDRWLAKPGQPAPSREDDASSLGGGANDLHK